jgi:quercetin dioxygenase-like cupin family protein
MPIRHNALGAEPKSTERVFVPIAGAPFGAGNFVAFENVLVPGAVIPLHQHAVEELLVCLAGEAECSFNGGPFEPYRAGSCVTIPANTPHTIRNTGAGELRQLSFFPAADQRTHWIEPAGSVTENAGD